MAADRGVRSGSVGGAVRSSILLDRAPRKPERTAPPGQARVDGQRPADQDPHTLRTMIASLHAEYIRAQTRLQSHELQRPERESDEYEDWFNAFDGLLDTVVDLLVEFGSRIHGVLIDAEDPLFERDLLVEFGSRIHGVLIDAEDRMFEIVKDYFANREDAVFNLIGVYREGIVLRYDCPKLEYSFPVDFAALDRLDARRRWRRLANWRRCAFALDSLREQAAAPGGAGYKRAMGSFVAGCEQEAKRAEHE